MPTPPERRSGVFFFIFATYVLVRAKELIRETTSVRRTHFNLQPSPHGKVASPPTPLPEPKSLILPAGTLSEQRGKRVEAVTRVLQVLCRHAGG